MPGSPATGGAPTDVRPDTTDLAATLADFDLPPGAPANLTLEQLPPTRLLQWLAVLETANIGELAGLTDDVRTLISTLPEADATATAGSSAATGAALHRLGLSLERVAAWGHPAGLGPELLALGQRLVALSETIH